MAYCCFLLVGKLIQWTVFGQLRVSEQQVCLYTNIYIYTNKVDCSISLAKANTCGVGQFALSSLYVQFSHFR